jgi:hypothetical protein
MRPAPATLVSLLMVAFLTSYENAHAQVVTGDLQFSVVDSLGDPIPGVNAAVTGPHVQGVRGTVSDDLGRCQVIALPPGVVSLRISHPAYRLVLVDNVRVQLGKTTSLGAIFMRQQVHDMPELVVTADRVLIDATSTTYGSNLRPADLDNLPVARNVNDVIALLPLSNSSYFGDAVNIGGATGSENKYFVDGVEVTDPLFQASGTALPYNFIQELEVRGGGYESDSRSALGGVLNVVTYSGTNEFHGSAFGFFTSNRFAANRRVGLLDPTQGGFSNYDAGASLGGPIIQDELWFFAAYNPTFARRDVEVPGYGMSVDQTVVNSFAAKLTWKASDQMRLVMTATGDPTTQSAIGNTLGIPPSGGLANSDMYFMNIGYGGINLSLNGTYTVGRDILIEGSIARVNRHDTGDPARSDEPYFVDNVLNQWSGGPPSRWDSFRYATMGRLAATLNMGTHSIKMGFEYKVNGTDNRYANNSIVKYNDTTYNEYVSKGYETVHDNIPSVFVQDLWQITRSLSVHAGIRWDGQDIIGSNGRLTQRVIVPLQPRVGFTYVPDDERTQKIFGSFGRYSQEFALFQSVNLFSDQGYSYAYQYNHDPRVSRSGAVTLPGGGPFTISPGTQGLHGQYYDEFSLGYERAIHGTIRVRIEGLYRTLREAIDDVYLASSGTWKIGNPGMGELAAWPKPERHYTALAITVERNSDPHFNFLASYVLSQDYGNYGGIFDAVIHGGYPNTSTAFDDLNSTTQFGKGLLPNDRTNVLKLAGSYQFDFGLAAGGSFIAESGTPLSEYAYTDFSGKLIAPRGSFGRTPAIWDLSARLAYELPLAAFQRARIILDMFHIASQRSVVDIQQARGYQDASGNLVWFDPTYRQAYRYQPPMSVRLGMEVSF